MSDDMKSNLSANIYRLRTKIRSNAALRDDLASVISSTLDAHGVIIDPKALEQMTVALNSEVYIGRAHVIADEDDEN